MKQFNLEEGIDRIKFMADVLSCGHVIIGITGGSCSGKGYFSKLLADKLDASILQMDDYYLGKSIMACETFDEPGAFDLKLFRENLADLKKGKIIKKPTYDFTVSERSSFETFAPPKILLIEGILSFYENLKELINIKIFIDASEEIRFNRRLSRDVAERGRTEKSVRNQWNNEVVPMYKKYIEPQKQYADIIIKNE